MLVLAQFRVCDTIQQEDEYSLWPTLRKILYTAIPFGINQHSKRKGCDHQQNCDILKAFKVIYHILCCEDKVLEIINKQLIYANLFVVCLYLPNYLKHCG